MVSTIEVNGKHEVVEVPPISEMQKLIFLREEPNRYDRDIEELEINSGISAIRKKRANAEKRYLAQLEAVIPTVKFTRDRFLESLGKNGDSYCEGGWKLVRRSTTRRAVNTAKFIEKYKDIALKICTIPVGKAEKILGEETLNPLCDATTTHSYELVNIDPDAR